MRTPETTVGGFQVAFLVFALIFLGYPIQKYLGPLMGIEDAGRLVSRLFIFIPLALLLALVPQFRRFSIEALGKPIPRQFRLEVGAVAMAKGLLLPIAAGGAVVLWHWTLGGEMALARRLGQQESVETTVARALTLEGLVFYFVLATLIAPLIEELLFRGLLYRAWEERWGWFWSMVATSALFAAYHPLPFAAFVSAIIFVVVYRRTGSIWACILVHGLSNALQSPALLGRFHMPTAGKETGEIALWAPHLSVLVLVLALIGIYTWTARESSEPEEPETEIRCA